MPNILPLRKAPLAGVPVPSSVEYDGKNLYTTDETGTRYAAQKSGVAGAIAAMVVPATTVAYVNNAATPVQCLIYGGTNTVVSVTRGAATVDIWTGAGVAIAGLAVTLDPGDAITFTYTAVPTVNLMPL